MKQDVLGVKVDNVTMAQAVAQLSQYIDTTDAHMVVTPNAEILYMCYYDKEFFDIVNSASFVAADGVGVLKAASILKTPIIEKVAGCELGYNLLFEAAKKGAGVFFFGSAEGIAEQCANNLKQKIPNLIVSGTRNGFFSEDQNDEIVNEINQSGAKVLWVCLGAPKQEKWMAKNRDKLKVGVMLGLGGSINLYAGVAKRAPKIFIKLKCEWLYRLLKEPYRIKRMMNIPKILVIAKKQAKRR